MGMILKTDDTETSSRLRAPSLLILPSVSGTKDLSFVVKHTDDFSFLESFV